MTVKTTTSAKVLILMLAIVLVIGFTVLEAAQLVSRSYSSSGYVHKHGNFLLCYDSACLRQVQSAFNYGNLSSGNNYLQTYLRNMGNANITLSITIVPINSTIISVVLSDNYTGAWLKPSQTIPVLWNITVAETSPYGSYYFNITISSFG